MPNSMHDKLKMPEESCQIDSVVPYVDKENEVINPLRESVDINKNLKNDKLDENKKEAKSSKIVSVLDSYCNTLNESTDFIECELTNKFKSASQKDVKKEFPSRSQVSDVMICEICKEDITGLNVYNRGIHVNNCIDKQISSSTEVTTKLSCNEDAFILECPLCFKHFSSPELRSNHIKKCGRSKGLSLQSILKALELQERHALERISLGLPAKPVKSVKLPKNPVSKKAIVQPKNKNQSDIQLAKALSLSLEDSTQQNTIEATQKITPVILKPPTANQKPGKKTKNILSSTPLLVLRSDEDRRKLLLEKVASILTLAIEHSSSVLNEADVAPQKEKTDDQEDLTLWYLSTKSSDKCQYYVEELLDWIRPSDVEMGDKLFHLSQIPGHKIVTQLPCEYTFNATEENNDSHCQTSVVLPITDQQSHSVIESLSSLVASSWMSDVDIHTACGTVIPAHKLLLAVRCPVLKQDSNFCLGKERASLKWETVSFDAALQFLNFIYTGNIDIKKDIVPDLFHLANKYEMFDLQILLNARNDDTKSEQVVKQGILTTGKEPSFPSSPCHVITTEMTEDTVCESQEDINMDLEIVYSCINSTLKPSQPINTQSAISGVADSFKCTQLPETKDNCIIHCMSDDDDEASNGSLKTLVCGKFSPKSDGPTSPVLFDINDSENDANDLDDNPNNESTVCLVNGSQNVVSRSSPVLLDVNDSENDANNLDDNPNNQSTVCLVNGSQNAASRLSSPVLFDINDNENDANDLDDNSNSENAVCLMNGSQNVASRSSNVSAGLLDTNFVESNSSDDSVKFLQSSYVSCNNTPEKTGKSISFSVLRNVSQDSPLLYQDKHDKKITPSEITKSDMNVYAEVKSSFISYSQVSDEKKDNLTPNCNESHVDLCCEVDSPVTSHSQRLLSSFHSVFKDKISDITVTKNDLQFFDRKLLDNENLINESSKIINSVENEFVTDAKSISQECDTKIAFKLSLESSSSRTNVNTLSAIKSDDNIIEMSPIKNAASPEILICDSDSDSKPQGSILHETSPLHDYHLNFSEKIIKSNSNSPANSLLSPGKSSHHILSDPMDDAVFESYDYFNHENSLSNGDYLQILSNSKYADENTTSPIKNNMQSVKSSTTPEKKDIVPITDYLQSPKLSTYSKEVETIKTATPSSKSEVQKPQFKFSDSPVTPFPDYKKMVTPEIRQALKRIGVKPLPRKKAVAILSHVYDETHPLIDAKKNSVINSEGSEAQLTNADKVNKPKKRKQIMQKSEKPAKKKQRENHSAEAILASPESDDCSSENPEWLGCVPEISFSMSTQDSPTKPSKDVIESLRKYIQSNDELYHNILNYIPLNLVEFHQELKKNDIKISIAKLMDFLDEQCITFTCPRKEEYKKKQAARNQRFRKNMILKLSQQASSNSKA